MVSCRRIGTAVRIGTRHRIVAGGAGMQGVSGRRKRGAILLPYVRAGT